MSADRWNAQFSRFAKSIGKDVARDLDLLLSAFLDAKATELRRQATYNGGPKERATAKRAARQLRSIFLARRFPVSAHKRRIFTHPAALLFRPKANRLRDRLDPNFLTSYVPMRSRIKKPGVTTLDLRDFSFAKAPGSTLDKLVALSKACAHRGEVRLNFCDDCDDVTPYIVLAHLRRSLPPVISGGNITNDVRDIIEAVGLREDLRIGTVGRAGRKQSRSKGYSVSAFRLTSRTPPGTFGDEDRQLRPQFKEFVADKFVDTINEWIGEHDLELTPEAEGSFVRAIGEALDNAERHGDALEDDTEGDWSIAAFSKLKFVRNAPLLQCSVGIVSIGATISESLGSAEDRVKTVIDQYVDLHASKLGRLGNRDSLRSVMALQDGITRDPEASAARRGGVGFMELVDVFAELGENGRQDHPSVLTIVSGRTCIRVTGAYRQGRKRTKSLRELWFNDSNDPGVPPSKEHVMTLDHDFPGVILSACFTIDPEHLRKKLHDGVSDA